MASVAPRASGRLRGSRRAEVAREFEVVSERPVAMQICNHAHLQKSEVWVPTMPLKRRENEACGAVYICMARFPSMPRRTLRVSTQQKRKGQVTKVNNQGKTRVI